MFGTRTACASNEPTTFCRAQKLFTSSQALWLSQWACMCAWYAMCMSSYVHDFININKVSVFVLDEETTRSIQTKLFMPQHLQYVVLLLTHAPNDHAFFRPSLFLVFNFSIGAFPSHCFIVLIPSIFNEVSFHSLNASHTLFANCQVSKYSCTSNPVVCLASQLRFPSWNKAYFRSLNVPKTVFEYTWNENFQLIQTLFQISHPPR